MAPVTLPKTGNASLEASWRRLACAGDKRARAYTSKRRGESALPRIRRGFWIGDQSFGTRRCQSSPCARSSGQGRDQVEENEGSVDPDLAHEETTMFRAVAARRPNTGPTLRSPL